MGFCCVTELKSNNRIAEEVISAAVVEVKWRNAIFVLYLKWMNGMAKKLTPDDILTDFKTTKKNTKRCNEEKQ
jgi:hypothetical protein